MRLKNKLILIFILFSIFVIFNNSNCFATYYSPQSHSYFESFVSYIENNIFDNYYNSYYIANVNDTLYCYVFNDENSFIIYSKNGDNKIVKVCLNLSFCHTFLALSCSSSGNVSSKLLDKSQYNGGYYVTSYFGTLNGVNGTITSEYFVCTSTIYSTDISLGNQQYSDLSQLFLNEEPYFVVEPEEPEQVIEPVTLYIDDQNFKKRFKFMFNIPLLKEDTKYYIFLDEYTRNSYNSVTADFFIVTVSTPEDYDYSEYDNYMYYDKLDNGKLYFPAGCTIQQFFVNGANNNDEIDLEVEYEFVPSRVKDTDGDIFDSIKYFTFADEEENHFYRDGEVLPLSYVMQGSEEVSDFLVPTYVNVSNINSANIIYLIWDAFLASSTPSPSTVLNSRAIKDYLNNRYYGDSLVYTFDDFSCSNHSIVSYENEKYYSSNPKTNNFYKIFRSTKVYDEENKIHDNCYAMNYIDGQDVSSMLPEGMSVEYLTSPFFKYNENSHSGGSIVYDTREIVNGDKIIDYSKEYNPIHNTYNGDYIENFSEGDNIVINNYYTDVIDKTSDENLLHNIYEAILDIKSKVGDMGDSIKNTTNNFNVEIPVFVNTLFVPNYFSIKDNLNGIRDAASNHLGLIYQPFTFLVYTVTLFANLDDTQEIVFDIPEINYNNTVLIQAHRFSFTDFFEDTPIIANIHHIYLTAVDFVLLGLLIKYAIKIFKEVFGK